MIRRKISLAVTVMFMLAGMPSLALAYNLIGADDLKVRIDTSQPTILVDIQPKNAYKEHHFYGSIRTFAYPAKTERDTESLMQAVRMYGNASNDVVIISPRGGRAAKRTVDYLITNGIPEEKIFILDGGISKWPYKNMLLNIKGGCS